MNSIHLDIKLSRRSMKLPFEHKTILCGKTWLWSKWKVDKKVKNFFYFLWLGMTANFFLLFNDDSPQAILSSMYWLIIVFDALAGLNAAINQHEIQCFLYCTVCGLPMSTSILMVYHHIELHKIWFFRIERKFYIHNF